MINLKFVSFYGINMENYLCLWTDDAEGILHVTLNSVSKSIPLQTWLLTWYKQHNDNIS